MSGLSIRVRFAHGDVGMVANGVVHGDHGAVVGDLGGRWDGSIDVSGLSEAIRVWFAHGDAGWWPMAWSMATMEPALTILAGPLDGSIDLSGLSIRIRFACGGRGKGD